MKSRGLVMVIDGDAEIRELLSGYLGNVGYEASVAADARQALDLLRDRPGPAAIVLDAALPPIDGRPFAEEMRSGSKAAPVLIMTSVREPSSAGGDASIHKPFQLVDFGDKLLRMLRQHQETP